MDCTIPASSAACCHSVAPHRPRSRCGRPTAPRRAPLPNGTRFRYRVRISGLVRVLSGQAPCRISRSLQARVVSTAASCLASVSALTRRLKFLTYCCSMGAAAGVRSAFQEARQAVRVPCRSTPLCQRSACPRIETIASFMVSAIRSVGDLPAALDVETTRSACQRRRPSSKRSVPVRRRCRLEPCAMSSGGVVAGNSGSRPRWGRAVRRRSHPPGTQNNASRRSVDRVGGYWSDMPLTLKGEVAAVQRDGLIRSAVNPPRRRRFRRHRCKPRHPAGSRRHRG